MLSAFQKPKTKKTEKIKSDASHESAEKYISIIIHLKYHFQRALYVGEVGVCGGAAATFLWILKHSENDSCDCKSVI